MVQSNSGKKIPDCPYMKGFSCRSFEFYSKRPVCSGYDDETGELFRCCWLPSWVKDGYHDAVFYDGKLHGVADKTPLFF